MRVSIRLGEECERKVLKKSVDCEGRGLAIVYRLQRCGRQKRRSEGRGSKSGIGDNPVEEFASGQAIDLCA